MRLSPGSLGKAFFLSLVLLQACSSDDKAKVCAGEYATPAGFDATTPAVSFSKDVHPILKSSACAQTNCHGANPNDGFIVINGDVNATYGQIVNVPSHKLPSMLEVKPGDAKNSFLMRKLDGDHCALDAQCEGKTCGDAMPNKEEQLSVEDRDKVRRWIAQGAKND